MVKQISEEQNRTEENLCQQVKSLLLMGASVDSIKFQVNKAINELHEHRCRYTPGPWEVLSSASFQNEIVSDGGDGRVVALLDRSDSEDEANARLIAAAPDLLEACEIIAALPLENFSGCEIGRAIRTAREAIANATD